MIGIGWVRSVGSKVTAARVGDAVSLSFGSCKKCTSCANNHPAYCNNFVPVNYGAGPAYKQQDGSSLAGYFFGQSSFSNLSNVPESSIVNISSLVTDEGDMAILAALGCSFQSGASTVTKLVGAGPKDSVVVIGLGAVGLAAVMVSNAYKRVFISCLLNSRRRLQKSKVVNRSLAWTVWHPD